MAIRITKRITYLGKDLKYECINKVNNGKGKKITLVKSDIIPMIQMGLVENAYVRQSKNGVISVIIKDKDIKTEAIKIDNNRGENINEFSKQYIEDKVRKYKSKLKALGTKYDLDISIDEYGKCKLTKVTCQDKQSKITIPEFIVDIENKEGVFSYCNAKQIDFRCKVNNLDGLFERYGVYSGDNTQENLEIRFSKEVSSRSINRMFKDSVSLKTIIVRGLRSELIENAVEAFSGCLRLEKIEILNKEKIGLTSLTDASSMFRGCENLYDLGTLGVNFNNIKYSSNMLKGCRVISKLDIRRYDCRCNYDILNSILIPEKSVEYYFGSNRKDKSFTLHGEKAGMYPMMIIKSINKGVAQIEMIRRDGKSLDIRSNIRGAEKKIQAINTIYSRERATMYEIYPGVDDSIEAKYAKVLFMVSGFRDRIEEFMGNNILEEDLEINKNLRNIVRRAIPEAKLHRCKIGNKHTGYIVIGGINKGNKMYIGITLDQYLGKLDRVVFQTVKPEGIEILNELD